jgi:hypothetical protein
MMPIKTIVALVFALAVALSSATAAAQCSGVGPNTITIDGQRTDWAGVCGWAMSDPGGDSTAPQLDIVESNYTHSDTGATQDFFLMTVAGDPNNLATRNTAIYEFRFVKGSTIIWVDVSWSTTLSQWITTCSATVSAPTCKKLDPAVGQGATVGGVTYWNIELGGAKAIDPSLGVGTYTAVAMNNSVAVDTTAALSVDPSNSYAGATPTAATILSFVSCTTSRGVDLHWETGAENGTIGFVVHRDSPEGPRVNPRSIPGLLNSPVGEHYRLFDANGTPASRYWLEEVAVEGSHVFGPAALACEGPSLEKKRIKRASTGHARAPSRNGKLASELFARVSAGGIYQIDRRGLSAVAPVRVSSLQTQVQLFRDGTRQPISAGPAADSFLFYAAPVTSAERATDAYRIEVGASVSPSSLAVGRVEPGTARDAAATVYPADVHLEEHHMIDMKAPPALRFPWGSAYGLAGEPSMPVSFTFDASGFAGGPATVTANVVGISDFGQPLQHHVQVSVNGVALGETKFGGVGEASISASMPAGLLKAMGNVLTLTVLADLGTANDFMALSSVDLSYARFFRADHDQLEFVADSSTTIRVDGFSSAPALVDITDPNSPQFLDGAAIGKTSLRFRDRRGLGERHYLAAVPRPVESLSASLAASVPAGSANWLAIYGEGLGDSLAPLVALRQSQGLTTLAVSADAVADLFGEGQHGPAALRAYLAQVTPPPQYVVLIGKATLDPHDYMGTGTADLVPTVFVQTPDYHSIAAADTALVATGDGLTPFAAVGRLPVETAAELDAVVAKIVAFETNGEPASGLAVFAADDHDPTTGVPNPMFQNESDIWSASLPTRAIKVYLPLQGHADLMAALALGPDLLSYHGHASGLEWSTQGLLSNADIASLPVARPFFLVTVDCWDGMFAMPWFPSLAQSLVQAPQGGAIAALASSSLVDDSRDPAIDRAIFPSLADPSVHTVGEVWLRTALALVGEGAPVSNLVQAYNLIGDPASPLPLR